jgi:hypothetical protein
LIGLPSRHSVNTTYPVLVAVEIKLSTWPEVTIKYFGTLAGKSLAGEVDPRLRSQYLCSRETCGAGRLGRSSCRRNRAGQRGQCGQAARQDGLKENRRSAFAQRPPSHRGAFAMSMTGTTLVRRVLVCMGSKPEFYIAKARECERRAQEMPPALRRTFLSWAAHWRKIASNAAKAEDRRQIEEAADNRKADKG